MPQKEIKIINTLAPNMKEITQHSSTTECQGIQWEDLPTLIKIKPLNEYMQGYEKSDCSK